MSPPHDAKTIARFFAKIEQPAHGHACWFLKNRRPYPTFSIKNKMRPMSQVSWEIHRSAAFPLGMNACHNCDNGPLGCVNPEHIRADTQSSNIKESRDKGRSVQGIKKQTHCKRGHELTPENSLYVKNSKWRSCKECSRMRRTEWARKTYLSRRTSTQPYTPWKKYREKNEQAAND